MQGFQRDPTGNYAVLYMLGFPKGGVDFDASGNAQLKDKAGTAQLSVATTGITIPTLATTTFTATTFTGGTNTATTASQLGSATAGAATSSRKIIGKKAAIADNTATSIITVTVPNAEHAAAIELTLVASLGTGTDTFESTRCAKGMIVLARQTGANVVAVAATLTLAQIATVSGGGTLTLAYSVAAVAGAVGAVNTFDIQVTLVKTGTITDLQCVFVAELINAQTTGVTMAAA